MKKFLSILILVIFGQFQITAVLAGADGTNELSKKNKNISEVKDCFETLNRGIFAFNQGLDKIFFKPICINFSQCAYIHSLRIKYRTLEERNLEQLLEDVSGEIPEATIVQEE